MSFFDTDDLNDMIDEISAVAEGIEMAPDIVREVLESYVPRWRQLDWTLMSSADVVSPSVTWSIRIRLNCEANEYSPTWTLIGFKNA